METVTVNEAFARTFPHLTPEARIQPDYSVRRVVDDYRRQGIVLEISDDQTQAMALGLAKQVTAEIAEYTAGLLSHENEVRLSRIYQGVLAVEDLINTVSDMEKLAEKHSLGFKRTILGITVIVRPDFDLNGCAFGNAVLLDGGFLRRSSKSRSRVLTAHEIWHCLSDNYFPTLLNEAFTDILTLRSLRGVDEVQPQMRMTRSYRLVYQIAQKVIDLVEPELAVEGYTRGDILEETLNQREEIVGYAIVDNRFHDVVREILGQRKGVYVWDRIVTLIFQKKFSKARRVLLSSI